MRFERSTPLGFLLATLRLFAGLTGCGLAFAGAATFYFAATARGLGTAGVPLLITAAGLAIAYGAFVRAPWERRVKSAKQ